MDEYEYRGMFDQAVEQLGPGQDKVETLRGSLARRCLDGQGKEVMPTRKRAGLLRGAVAAALCLALAGTAVAASPGLREVLAAALGGFAPYAQEQEGEPYVINGIEFRVKSVLADGFTIRAYVEAKDLEGGIFSRIDDLTIPTRISGGMCVPAITEWFDPGAAESWSSSAECLGYDEGTGTALLVISCWKLMPEDFTGAAVELREMNSYLTGDYEVVWRNEEDITIPVDVKPVESIVLDADSPLASGLDAAEVRLSPLGLTFIFEDYHIWRPAVERDSGSVSVKLKDGSIVEAPQGNACGVFLPPLGDGDSYRVRVWNFLEPVEAEQVEGIYVGGDYFPMQ